MKSNDLIRPQFCTSHSSSAAVACANLWPDWMNRTESSAINNSDKFELWGCKLFCEIGASKDPCGTPAVCTDCDRFRQRREIQMDVSPKLLNCRAYFTDNCQQYTEYLSYRWYCSYQPHPWPQDVLYIFSCVCMLRPYIQNRNSIPQDSHNIFCWYEILQRRHVGRRTGPCLRKSGHIDGLLKGCSISIGNAQEIIVLH